MVNGIGYEVEATDDGMLQWSLLRLLNSFRFFFSFASSTFLPFFFFFFSVFVICHIEHPTARIQATWSEIKDVCSTLLFSIFFSLYFFFCCSFTCHAKCVLTLHNSTTIHGWNNIYALHCVHCVQPTGRCENQKIFIFIYVRRTLFAILFQFLETAVPLRKWTPNTKRWTLNTLISAFDEFASCQNCRLSGWAYGWADWNRFCIHTTVKLKQIMIIFPRDRSSLHTQAHKGKQGKETINRNNQLNS